MFLVCDTLRHVDVHGPGCHQDQPCLGPWSCWGRGMLMSTIHVTTEAHARCPWPVLPPGAMLMPVGQATSGDHTGVHVPCCHGDHIDFLACAAAEVMLVSGSSATANGRVDACELYCHWRLC